jgi:hypothetical protein
MLQSKQFLYMHEILQPIIINFQTLDWQLPLKWIRIELSHLIMIYIQLLQLLQIL